MTLPTLGLIEGYYGEPWSWAARTDTMRFLAPHGYGFYIYAPKADTYLRRRWRDLHPPEMREPLARFAADCRAAAVKFGVGLSPYELYRAFDGEARADLARKLDDLKGLGLDWLAILFDDMKGDLPGLADRQVEIMRFIAERAGVERLILCPTYYTDDPVLDRVFGPRPEGYLVELGRALDPAIDVFWTGEEVCAQEFSVAHLRRVADALGRKPFIWDNYPVNDGQRMSRFLHLRAFTGRPAAMAEHIAGHAVNPALQPVLSRIPCLSLVESYKLGEAYAYGEAFRRAAREVAGEALAERLWRDLGLLQDSALERMSAYKDRLRDRYAAFDHDAAREVVAFLDGAYAFDGELE